jgi:hypothetical protein
MELLNILRINTMLKDSKRDDDAGIEKKIKIVMNKEKYI